MDSGLKQIIYNESLGELSFLSLENTAFISGKFQDLNNLIGIQC